MEQNKIYGTSLTENEYYTLADIKKAFGAKKAIVDCSYIVLSNPDWDNDAILYIQSSIIKDSVNTYLVSEDN